MPGKWFVSCFFVLCCLFVPACASEVSSETPIPVQTSTPALSVTQSSPFFSPENTNPVLAHGASENWFGGAVEPGAVLISSGEWLMYFNGFSGWPAKSKVGLAVSPDGLTWELQSEMPLLDSAEEVFDGYTFFVSSVLQLKSGEWAMYLYTLDEGRDGAPGAILMATADHPEGPWGLIEGFVLEPGSDGDWDASRVTQPNVLRVGDEYWMYFAGYENDRLQGTRQIGLAVSEDGYSWEKIPGPVFTVSPDLKDWDSHRVFQPRVMQTGNQFTMIYKSNVSVGRAEGWGFATSVDGLNWERDPSNPFIDENTYGIEWRRNGIGDWIFVDGEYNFFLEILEREGGGYHHGNSAYGSNVFLLKADRVP